MATSTTASWLMYNATMASMNYTDGFDNTTAPRMCQMTKWPYDFYTSLISYGIMFVIGVTGNSLVIFVVTRYTKMKTVTNLYILNLSIADLVFLLGMPMIMTTMIVGKWVFGFVVCKVYYILTCINMFTSTMTLLVMSGDRFLAVCFPISSMRYRTPKYALVVIGFTWILSFFISMPIILYARTLTNARGDASCTIVWPSDNNTKGSVIYIAYTAVFGFILPVFIIFVLYTLLVIRLRKSGVAMKHSHKRRPHRKVTKLVTLVITVYIICSLPYWAFQVYLVSRKTCVSHALVIAYKLFTLLHYANSMVNPLLYAFTNQNFRESFISAFKCAADPILLGGRATECQSGELHTEGAMSQFHHNKAQNVKTEYEFTKLSNLSSEKPQSNGQISHSNSTMKDKCVETTDLDES